MAQKPGRDDVTELEAPILCRRLCEEGDVLLHRSIRLCQSKGTAGQVLDRQLRSFCGYDPGERLQAFGHGGKGVLHASRECRGATGVDDKA